MLNRHTHRLDARSPRLILGALTLLASSVAAQVQTNSPQGSLSINGTGHLESGILVATNSQSSSTPSATAPAYTHRTAPFASLELRMEGNPNRPFVLAIGTIAASPFIIGAQRVELDFATIQTFIDGSAPGIYNSFANTGNSGSWSMILPSGVPANFPTYSLQGAVFDPTVVNGVRLTGTVSLQSLNTIEVLNRNLLDAFGQAPRYPQYLASLLSSTFLYNGFNAGQWITGAIDDMTPSPSEGTPLGLDYIGSGPNTSIAAALPTGAPTPAQVVVEHLEMRFRFSMSCSNLGTTLMSSRDREYELRVKEQNGVWRFDGDQRAVECEVQPLVGPAAIPTAQNQGLDARIIVHVSDELGQHGGIASILCTGPQLQNINGFGQSTTSASGSQLMQQSNGDGDTWFLGVNVALAGTSRLPFVENGSGPRDTYSVTVTWNDNTISGPYSVTLRSSIDVAANPALALAAMPGLTAPATTATLSQAGLAGATCAVNFTDGVFPVGVALGQLEVQVQQGGNNPYYNMDGYIPVPGLAQTLSLCTPYLGGGSSTIKVARQDIFGAEFFTNTTLNL